VTQEARRHDRDLAAAGSVRRERLGVVGGVARSPIRRGTRQLYGAAWPSRPAQTFFFRATWINVIVGPRVHPGRAAPAARGLSISRVGRASSSTSVRAWRSSGQPGTAMLLVSGVLDVIFAGCFLYILWVQRAGPRVGR
jgi:hypothetical protein